MKRRVRGHRRRVGKRKVKVKTHKRKVKKKLFLTTKDVRRARGESERFLSELKEQEFKDEPGQLIPEMAQHNLLSEDFAQEVRDGEEKKFWDDGW